MTMWHVMCSLGPVPLVAIRKIRIMVRVSFWVLLSVVVVVEIFYLQHIILYIKMS